MVGYYKRAEMSYDSMTIVLDTEDAIELGEALLDAGYETNSTGLRHSVEFVRSKAVALPDPSIPKIEVSRNEINFQVMP
jgi:hypothetical protein